MTASKRLLARVLFGRTNPEGFDVKFDGIHDNTNRDNLLENGRLDYSETTKSIRVLAVIVSVKDRFTGESRKIFLTPGEAKMVLENWGDPVEWELAERKLWTVRRRRYSSDPEKAEPRAIKQFAKWKSEARALTKISEIMERQGIRLSPFLIEDIQNQKTKSLAHSEPMLGKCKTWESVYQRYNRFLIEAKKLKRILMFEIQDFKQKNPSWEFDRDRIAEEIQTEKQSDQAFLHDQIRRVMMNSVRDGQIREAVEAGDRNELSRHLEDQRQAEEWASRGWKPGEDWQWARYHPMRMKYGDPWELFCDKNDRLDLRQVREWQQSIPNEDLVQHPYMLSRPTFEYDPSRDLRGLSDEELEDR